MHKTGSQSRVQIFIMAIYVWPRRASEENSLGIPLGMTID
jgi:hypothetical protein